MKIHGSSLVFLFFFILHIFFSLIPGFVPFAEAGKRRIEIPDNLNDVVDEEEDDAWKEWGKKSTTPEFDPPPDFSNMDFAQIQEEMAKRSFGPAFGFVKLRLGIRRTPETVSEIAMKWTKVLRTGGIAIKFMSVDLSTIMFNMDSGKDVSEMRAFVLNQPEAYEIKVGDQVFRRPGDPPLEEVIEKLQAEKKEDAVASPKEQQEQEAHAKEEL